MLSTLGRSVSGRAMHGISRTAIALSVTAATVAGSVYAVAGPIAPLAVSQEVTTPKTGASMADAIPADLIAGGIVTDPAQILYTANTITGAVTFMDSTTTPQVGKNDIYSNAGVPDGTKVYMQWIDGDGAVSPIYVAQTHSSVGGTEGGPGTFAFDVPRWRDGSGVFHDLDVLGSEGDTFKVWVDPNFSAPETGNAVAVVRTAPGEWTYPTFSNARKGQDWGAVGIDNPTNNFHNVVNFLYEVPGDYMFADEVLDSASLEASVDQYVKGRVWLENDGSSLGSGPISTGANHTGESNLDDTFLEGYTVIASALTPAAAEAYDAIVDSPATRTPDERTTAAALTKQFLADNPDAIAATVQATTDADGNYQINFPAGVDKDHIYMAVKDKDGNFVQAYTTYTRPYFGQPNDIGSVNPPSAAYVVDHWYNVHFAVVRYAPITVNINDYDMFDNPAAPGEELTADFEGTIFEEVPGTVVWTQETTGADGKQQGTVLWECTDITSIEAAEACTLPAGKTEDGTTVRVEYKVGDATVAADSVLVSSDTRDNREYRNGRYDDMYAVPGPAQSEAPTFDNRLTGEKGVSAPAGTEFTLLDANGLPVTGVDRNTGVVSFDFPKDTAGLPREVIVRAMFPDDSYTDIPLTVRDRKDPTGDLDGDGIPNMYDPDMDGDGINNDDERITGGSAFPVDPWDPETTTGQPDGSLDSDGDTKANADESFVPQKDGKDIPVPQGMNEDGVVTGWGRTPSDKPGALVDWEGAKTPEGLPEGMSIPTDTYTQVREDGVTDVVIRDVRGNTYTDGEDNVGDIIDGPLGDIDGDGIKNGEDPDADGDGVTNDDELATPDLNPLNPISDPKKGNDGQRNEDGDPFTNSQESDVPVDPNTGNDLPVPLNPETGLGKTGITDKNGNNKADLIDPLGFNDPYTGYYDAQTPNVGATITVTPQWIDTKTQDKVTTPAGTVYTLDESTIPEGWDVVGFDPNTGVAQITVPEGAVTGVENVIKVTATVPGIDHPVAMPIKVTPQAKEIGFNISQCFVDDGHPEKNPLWYILPLAILGLLSQIDLPMPAAIKEQMDKFKINNTGNQVEQPEVIKQINSQIAATGIEINGAGIAAILGLTAAAALIAAYYLSKCITGEGWNFGEDGDIKSVLSSDPSLQGNTGQAANQGATGSSDNNAASGSSKADATEEANATEEAKPSESATDPTE